VTSGLCACVPQDAIRTAAAAKYANERERGRERHEDKGTYRQTDSYTANLQLTVDMRYRAWKHPTSPKVHYSEGLLVRRVRVGVKGYLYHIIFYYTLKTNTRQVRTSEPFS